MDTEVKKAAKALRKAAESPPMHKHVFAPAMKPGQMFAQGDIGIICIASLPTGARKVEWPSNGQVAPGNTKGSRHCVGDCDGQFYRIEGDALSDLCFEARETWTLKHPEHGDVTCDPGLYQFVHQQNEKLERVRD